MADELPPVAVTVNSQYIASQSAPELGQFLFHYHIELLNVSEHPLTLNYRHWWITNGNGEQQQIEGVGVVGQTPTLLPGQHFHYTSSVILSTPVGSMTGFYTLEGNNETVRVPIPRFQLAVPGTLH